MPCLSGPLDSSNDVSGSPGRVDIGRLLSGHNTSYGSNLTCSQTQFPPTSAGDIDSLISLILGVQRSIVFTVLSYRKSDTFQPDRYIDKKLLNACILKKLCSVVRQMLNKTLLTDLLPMKLAIPQPGKFGSIENQIKTRGILT